MKQKSKFQNLTRTTLMVSALTLGANIVANDITPGSWNAYADHHEEKSSEHKCGEGSCGEKKMKKADKKASEHKCGEGECGADKKSAEKGSDGSCGAETCGA